jgi:spermidine/putrescine transport system ATP-binding protein
MDGGLVKVELPGSGSLRARAPEGVQAAGRMTLAVRPEKISLLRDLPGSAAPDWDRLTGQLEEIVYVGTHTQYLLRLPGGQIVTVHRQNRAIGEAEPQVGEPLTALFNPLSAALLAD